MTGFVWDLVGNPEDRFSHNEAQIKPKGQVFSQSNSFLQVNWMPKMSKEQVMKGVLPGVKAPLSVSEAKYCQVSVTDKTDIEVGFILK